MLFQRWFNVFSGSGREELIEAVFKKVVLENKVSGPYENKLKLP